MIRYIFIILVYGSVSSQMAGQVSSVQNAAFRYAFDENLFLHVVHDGAHNDIGLYGTWKADQELALAENLTGYAYKKKIRNQDLNDVKNPKIVLDLVKQDILAQDYSNALSTIGNISFSDLSKDHQAEYQFYKAYLLFVHKDFEIAKKIFDSAQSLKSEFKFSSLYYSAFCDMFTGNYTASAEKFSLLMNHRIYSKELPYYLSILYYKEGKYNEVIKELSRSTAQTSSVHRNAMQNLLNRAYYKESKWNKLSEVLLSESNCCENVEQHYFLGLSLYKQGKYQEAIPHLTASTDMESEEGQNALLALGHLYNKKNPNLALPFFKEVAQMSYNSGLKDQAIISLAHYYEEKKDPEKALQYISRISEESEYFTQSLHTETRIYYVNKEYKKALKTVLRIKDLNAELGMLYHDLLNKNARISHGQGRKQEAIQYFKESIQLENNTKSKMEATVSLARIYFNEKNYIETLKLIQQHENLENESNTKDLLGSFELSYIKAYCFLSNKNYRKSISSFTKSEQLLKAVYKNDALVHQALSNEPHKQSYFAFDQGGKAEVMPKHNAFMSRHSVVGEDFANAEQEEKNKFYGGQDLVLGALTIYETQYEDILLRKADCYLKIGDKVKAEETYGLAYEKAINQGDYALYQKGKVEDLLGEPYLHLATYEKLEKEYPTSKYLIDSQLKKGSVLINLGKDKEAYDQFVKVYKSKIASENDKFFALMRLGLINYNQGDVESALVYYKRLFEGENLSKKQSKEALTLIEEIYLNNLKDSKGYYAFLEQIGNKKMTHSDKDSIDFYLAYEEISINKKSALIKLQSYINKYDKGTYKSRALLESAKIQESLSEHEGAINSYDQLASYSSKHTAIALDRIVFNLSKLDNRYEDYINYNKKILALNISPEKNALVYARIAKAAVKANLISQNEKEILLALENNTLTFGEKESITLELAKSYLTNRYYANAITHLKRLSLSKDVAISSEALYLVAERLYEMNKRAEGLIIIAKLQAKSGVNKNLLAKSIIIQSRIHLDNVELEAASAGIETILKQNDIDPEILKSADEVMKLIHMKRKEISAQKRPTIELQYGTYD